MKFINPSVEYLPQPAGIEGVWHQIAVATRTCYQSQARQGESDEEFVKRVILKPALVEGDLNNLKNCKFNILKLHGGTLEYGTVYLLLAGKSLAERFMDNPYSRVEQNNYNSYCVTTNMRVLIESHSVFLLDCIVSPTEHHAKRYTFNVITDIGVTREGNRHRKNSIAEESTRYNAYDKGKYGSELTYTTPAWEDTANLNGYIEGRSLKDMAHDVATGHTEDWTAQDYYMFGLWSSEFAYMGMRSKGEKAEKTRQVLNINTKTQIVWTAYADDWQHFLALRADNISGKSHPNIQYVANEIRRIAEEQKLW